ncbi:unnamed protein product [Symbiodinium sp. CCMP2592]|nr:unnamed protein product [Symbiodinium sp. CCMP2592]
MEHLNIIHVVYTQAKDAAHFDALALKALTSLQPEIRKSVEAKLRALQGLPSQAAPAVPAQPVETTAVPDPASAAVFAEAPVNPRPASPASAAVSAEAPVPTPASPAPAAVSAGAPLPPAKPASAAAVSAEAPLPTPASPAPAAVSAGAPLPPARPASAAAESAEAPVPTAASPASAVSAEAPLPTLASSAAVSAKAPVPAPAGVPTVPAVRASGEATAAVSPWPCNYVAAAAASSPASAAVFATAPVPVVEAPVPTPASLAAAVSASAPVPTPASPASAAVSAGALLPTVSAEAPVLLVRPPPQCLPEHLSRHRRGQPLPPQCVAKPASAAAVSAETPLPTPASLASAAVSAGRPASTAVSAKAPPPTLARPASAAAPAEAPVPTLASPASAAVSAEAPVPRPLMLAVPHTTFFAAAAEAVPTQPAVDRPSLKRRPPIDPDALPVLTPEHKAKYANYWTSYFKKQKSESELSMPSTPPTTSPTTPASTVDSNDMLESLMQKARHDSAFLSRLLSLAGLDSPSASVAPPLSTSSAPASLDPVPSQVPPQPAPAVAAAVPTVPNPALTVPPKADPAVAPAIATVPSSALTMPSQAAPVAIPAVPNPPLAVPQAAPAAPAMPVVTVPEAAPASAMQTLEVAVQQEDFKCTSKTHPAAWAKMNRFVARNEVCKELGKAWQAGGDTRLSMFQKWVAVNGRGLDLEAAVQMKVIRETEEVDQGVYVSWSGVLAHFEQDINKSLAFAARRRAEHKGTKRDRNDPTVEKFLLWNDATVTDEVCLEVGCKVADVEQLLSSMDSDPLFYKRNALPERGAPDSTVTEAKAKAKFQKEMYTELPADCCADDVQEFVTSWMAAVSDAQGQAAILCSELQDLESQEKLMGLIDSVKLQLADLRKEMGAINVGSEDALTLVAAVCDKAKPLVNLYKITAEKQQTMPAKKKSKTDLKNEEGNE